MLNSRILNSFITLKAGVQSASLALFVWKLLIVKTMRTALTITIHLIIVSLVHARLYSKSFLHSFVPQWRFSCQRRVGRFQSTGSPLVVENPSPSEIVLKTTLSVINGNISLPLKCSSFQDLESFLTELVTRNSSMTMNKEALDMITNTFKECSELPCSLNTFSSVLDSMSKLYVIHDFDVELRNQIGKMCVKAFSDIDPLEEGAASNASTLLLALSTLRFNLKLISPTLNELVLQFLEQSLLLGKQTCIASCVTSLAYLQLKWSEFPKRFRLAIESQIDSQLEVIKGEDLESIVYTFGYLEATFNDLSPVFAGRLISAIDYQCTIGSKELKIKFATRLPNMKLNWRKINLNFRKNLEEGFITLIETDHRYALFKLQQMEAVFEDFTTAFKRYLTTDMFIDIENFRDDKLCSVIHRLGKLKSKWEWIPPAIQEAIIKEIEKRLPRLTQQCQLDTAFGLTNLHAKFDTLPPSIQNLCMNYLHSGFLGSGFGVTSIMNNMARMQMKYSQFSTYTKSLINRALKSNQFDEVGLTVICSALIHMNAHLEESSAITRELKELLSKQLTEAAKVKPFAFRKVSSYVLPLDQSVAMIFKTPLIDAKHL